MMFRMVVPLLKPSSLVLNAAMMLFFGMVSWYSERMAWIRRDLKWKLAILRLWMISSFWSSCELQAASMVSSPGFPHVGYGGMVATAIKIELVMSTP